MSKRLSRDDLIAKNTGQRRSGRESGDLMRDELIERNEPSTPLSEKDPLDLAGALTETAPHGSPGFGPEGPGRTAKEQHTRWPGQP